MRLPSRPGKGRGFHVDCMNGLSNLRRMIKIYPRRSTESRIRLFWRTKILLKRSSSPDFHSQNVIISTSILLLQIRPNRMCLDSSAIELLSSKVGAHEGGSRDILPSSQGRSLNCCRSPSCRPELDVLNQHNTALSHPCHSVHAFPNRRLASACTARIPRELSSLGGPPRHRSCPWQKISPPRLAPSPATALSSASMTARKAALSCSCAALFTPG